MNSDDIRLTYGRQQLRKATKFTEGDYNGINPRQFYRSLKRSLEEIQEDGDFKYQTVGTQDTSLSIESEDVGGSTGTVEGRLAASSDEREIGSGTIKYKPYGPHGALAIALGLLFSIFTVGISLIVSVIGAYFYFKEEQGEIPVSRQDVIRALISGEVSERTIEDDSESRTDIFANMSVIYAGDTFVNVNTEEFDDLDWAHRVAIVNQVTKWHNQVVDDETLIRDVDDGFIGHLKAWSNRNTQSDIQTVNSRHAQH